MPVYVLGLLILFLIVFVVVSVSGIRTRRARTDHKLESKFDRLRQLIVEGMDDTQRPEADQLLDRCSEYLDSMLRAQEKLELIEGMQRDVRELTGEGIEVDSQMIQERVRSDMSRFFEELSRISAVTDFDDDRTLDRLSEFTEGLEDKRDALEELTSGDWPDEDAIAQFESEQKREYNVEA